MKALFIIIIAATQIIGACLVAVVELVRELRNRCAVVALSDFDDEIIRTRQLRAAVESPSRDIDLPQAPAVACLQCGAQPGEWCRTGFPFTVHNTRIEQ